MGDAIISRRGGSFRLQALSPTITKVSETATSITFTLTNNDDSTAVILYEVGDTTPDANSIELAAAATSSNLTISGLTRTSVLTLYATANVTGKVLSNVAEVVYDELIYTAATGGTTAEYDDGGKRYKSHTFTSNETFEVTTAGNGDRNQVDYLIIAGGAGGALGGGGAGGYLTTISPTPGDVTPNSKVTVTATSFGVIVGGGGSGGNGSEPGVVGVNGTNSSIAFATTITADGGGRGGTFNNTSSGAPNIGGSGGGGSITGAAGITGQGFSGGSGSSVTSPYTGGGGGGASANGTTSTGTVSGNGGNGLANTLRNGTSETRAGGGAGGILSFGLTRGTGGDGGGGAGGDSGNVGTNGTANTGSGGGGGGQGRSAGSGGSGIVVIRYEIAPSV